jgi:hypothetical protein
MVATFIKINETRLIKSSIKRYISDGATGIKIYFCPSRTKLDVETFSFLSKKRRDEMIATLDGLFL